MLKKFPSIRTPAIRRFFAFASVIVLACIFSASQSSYRTLRVDYYHSGNATEEHFSLDGIVLEGSWAGPPDHWVDDTNLGKYLFEVIDKGTGRILYSRGFASIYGEWELTAEAKESKRTFHESVRFPAFVEPVRVAIKKREKGNAFREIWTTNVDPASNQVDRSETVSSRVWAIMKNGEPRNKVDLLLMGDGYTAGEMKKWHRDARRMVEILFSVSPFKERKGDFNVWAVDTPSEQSGISRPSDKVYRRSALRAAYDALGTERYVLTLDNKRMREAAAAASYDFIEIVVNDRKYGGGGIFNLYATAAADNLWSPYIFVHEFGHLFAGLADEYYTSDVAYESRTERPEPWEPNATADPGGGRWRDLISPGTPLPTPWPKAAFEAMQKENQTRRREIRAKGRPEQEMEALFLAERDRSTQLLGSTSYAGKVGAFEGANYEAEGYYRPQVDCIMFTRDDVGFCAVCRRAIEHMVDLYIR
jgi:hypothetical protein